MAPDQHSIDLQHLKTLAILHYVLGGLLILSSVFTMLLIGVGIFFFSIPASLPPRNPTGPPPPDPAFFSMIAWIYCLMGGIGTFLYWLLAGLVIAAGRCLGRCRRWTFCMVATSVGCIFIPVGTILGIFTIIVLVRPTVKELFEGQTPRSLPPLPE